jgi:hypothetical protein
MRWHGRLAVLVVVLGLVVVSTVGVASAEDPGPSGYFFDDDGNTHEAAIQAIRNEGITKGCNPPQNTNYCPDGTVTRGQMAAFLNRALHLPAASRDFFSDDNDSVFEGDINRLAASGITKGCNPPANTMYCPDGSVTRGQMAAFLVRGFGYTDNGGGDLFVDDDDSIFEGDIDRLGTAGVTKGCNPPANNRYCPNDRVKRDQMASFLTRALGLSAQAPTLDHSTQNGAGFSLIAAAQDAGCAAAFAVISDGVLDVCRVATSIPRYSEFWVEHGFFESHWSLLTPAERAQAVADLQTGTFWLFLNGTGLQTHEFLYVDESDDTINRTFNFQFPAWFQGTHRLVGDWIFNGFLEFRVIADVTFTEP